MIKMEDTKIRTFQVINEAIHLDSIGDVEKAYVKYIQSLLAISGYLMEQFHSTGFPYEVQNCKSIQKILIVGRQCWERLDNLLDKGKKTENKQNPAQLSETVSSPSIVSENSLDNKMSFKSRTHISSSPSNSNMIRLQSTSTQPLQLSPLEKCALDNAKLRKMFQSRMMHAKNATVKANLSLEYHRQVEDNIAVAKAKEREHLMEQQRREKKALEQATKILSQSRQVSLTELESEKCHLYADILQYEEHQTWTKNLRIRLASHPTDHALVEEVVKTTLQRVDHPLSKWLLKKQTLVREKCTYPTELPKQCTSKDQMSTNKCDTERGTKISNQQKSNGQVIVNSKVIANNSGDMDDFKNCLEDTVNNTLNICDTCILMLVLTYEKLNESDIAQDICHRVVEDIVLGPIWQHLTFLFRCYNKQSEHRIAQSLKGFADCLPKDFGLKTIIINQHFSYDDCAAKLKGILSITSPVLKLQSLVQAIQKFCESQKVGEDGSPLTPTLLGADDLIPMLSYILVKAGQSCLFSEFQALEQLLDQRYLLGEEGYCLTSCQMAFNYLEAQADKFSS